MKKMIHVLAITCLMAGVAFRVHATVYDLAADFSATANPTTNGWQYSQSLGNSGGPLPSVADWQAADFGLGIPGYIGTTSDPNSLAGVAKRIDNGTDNPAGFDIPTNSIMLYNQASVLWKAATNDVGGSLSITGSLWHINVGSQDTTFKIFKNDTLLLSQGGVVSDLSGTSDFPYSLTNGTGGDSNLVNIPYVANDTIRVEILGPGNFAFPRYVGLNLSIITSTNIAPSVLTITSQPQSKNVNSGATVNLTVGATGTPPLHYQWRKGSVEIAGTTNLTLTLNNVTTNDSGSYDVVVSNATDSKTSSPPAIVTVFRPPTVYPGTPHDLKTEFSLDSNPTSSGWQYSDSLGLGGGIFVPSVMTADWNAPDFGAGQPGWQGSSGRPHAGYAKRIDNGTVPAGKDAPIGTIMTHGDTSVLWTAPTGDPGGTANISGSIYNLRHIGRGGAWRVWKNDSELLISGTVDDNSGSSAAPLNIEQGTGGAGPSGLQNIPYVAGDTFRFELLEGDFQGLNFTIYTMVVGPIISVTKSGNDLVLTWSGGGVLQSAPAVTGTFTDILGSTSPYTVVPTGTQMFFRVRQN